MFFKLAFEEIKQGSEFSLLVCCEHIYVYIFWFKQKTADEGIQIHCGKLVLLCYWFWHLLQGVLLQRAHEGPLLLCRLEAAVAELGGGVDELELDGLQVFA